MPRLVLLALVLVISLTACGDRKQSAAATPLIAQSKAIDALFEEYARRGSPGVAVGIYKGGRQMYAAGYGYADLDNEIAITPDTVFQIASSSKQFAAFATLLLARDGKISLDGELRNYLGYVPDFGHKITPRNLLYHTSGLRDQWDLFAMSGRDVGDQLRQAQVVAMVSRQRALNFPPGRSFEYCNTGYTLLAELVKAASGQTLRQFTDARMFAPLGMHHTFFADDATEIIPHRAHAYERGEHGWRRSLLNHDNVGATGLYATVGDLLKWAANFKHPAVGDAALIREFSAMGRLDDGTAIEYGFGLTIRTFAGHRALYHNGADAAFRSQFAYFPDQDFAVVLLANNAMDLQPALEKIAALFLPDASGGRQQLPALVTPERALVEALAGRYLGPDGTTMTLSLGSHGLVVQSKQRDRTLNFWQDGAFDIEDQRRAAGSYFRPVLDDRRRVTAIELVANDVVSRFSRFEQESMRMVNLAGLAGDYHSAELDLTFHVAAQADGLAIESIWLEKAIKLSATRADHFEGVYPFDRVRVARDDGGRPVALLVSTVRMIDLRLDRVESNGSSSEK